MEKYAKVRVLGKGSFGSAILIKRRSDNALLVIKEVSLAKMSRKEREEARHECRVLQQLNHPNIVRYVEHFENKNNLYIVMEYCDGGDLHGKLKSGPMKESTILYYYSQVCLAMEYLHSRHILHRDIKTMNVFLMKNGSVKLGDFGISTVLRNTMGMANTVCGTPYYFSPEICRNKPYNNKSDVWALGVLLYELATGKHPFDGNSMNQLMQRIVKGTYHPLPNHFSSEFRKMVEWCLQKDPSRRPSIKQALSLPIVRRSLEQLEENLMLATQCKVRLKDIIDFDVGSNDNNNKNGKYDISGQPKQDQTPRVTPSPSPQHQQQQNRQNELSPGRAAALALADQHQQQRLQPKSDAALDFLVQRPSGNLALLGPKPSAPGAAVDHNRIDNYRKYLQQQYQRRGGGGEKEPVASSPVNNHNNNHNNNNIGVSPSNHASPYARSPSPASPAVSPRNHHQNQHHQQQQQQQQRYAIPAVDHRNLNNNNNNNNEPPKREVAGTGANNDGFDERMQRIDAIMKRYAQNVDPNARDNIQAYMKRKQEEYMQHKKQDLEREKRRAEIRKKELAKVLEYQNKVGRGEQANQQRYQHNHHYYHQHQQQQKLANQKPIVYPQPAAPVYPSPSSPPKQQNQQNVNFGQDPRCAPKTSQEIESSPPSRKGYIHVYNAGNGPNKQQQQLGANPKRKDKVLAANSPRVLPIPKSKQTQQINSLDPSPRVDPQRPSQIQAGAAAAAVAAYEKEKAQAAARQNKNDNDIHKNNINQKLIPPTPVAGRGGLSMPSNGGRMSEPHLVLKQSSVVKVSPSQQQQQQYQQQQPKKPNAMLRIISAPVLATPAEGGNRCNTDDDNDELDDKNNIKKAVAPSLSNPRAFVRRSSAPSSTPNHDIIFNHDNPLNGLHVVGGKQIIRPTAAAGFMPQGVNSKSPLKFVSKDELPAAVEARRRLEQRRHHIQLSEVKLQIDEKSSKKDLIPPTNNNNNNNNNGLEINNNTKKTKNNINIEKEDKIPSSLAIQNGFINENNNDQRPRKKEIPPPLSLAPLQKRPTPLIIPQSSSPSFVPSPIKAAAAGIHVPINRPVAKSLQPRSSSISSNNIHNALGIGIMPAVLGVKVPAQPRVIVGGRRESNLVQNEVISEPPVLVDIDYGVSSVPPDEVIKQTTPTESGIVGRLPSLGDGISDPPDVVQQWRNVVDSNGTHKMSLRSQLVHLQTSNIHETLPINEGNDVLVAFQKARDSRPSIPSTLEILRTVRENENDDETNSVGQQRSSVSLTLLKQKQLKQKQQEFPSLSSLPCVMPTNLPVPISVDNIPQPPTPTLIPSSDNISSSSPETSHRDEAEEEERAALLALVDGVSDLRYKDEFDRSDPSISSIDIPEERSLEGYIAMLDHLKGLLYRQRKNSKSNHIREEEEKELKMQLPLPLPPNITRDDNNGSLLSKSISNSISHDLPTPRGFLYTKPAGNSQENSNNNQKLQQPLESNEEEQNNNIFEEDEEEFNDSGDEEIDEENNTNDDDEDFEDAMPLSPVRCTTINDNYRRLLENADRLPYIQPGKVSHNDDYNGDNNNIENEVDENIEKKINKGINNDIIENVSFLDIGDGEIEGDTDGGYTMYLQTDNTSDTPNSDAAKKVNGKEN